MPRFQLKRPVALLLVSLHKTLRMLCILHLCSSFLCPVTVVVCCYMFLTTKTITEPFFFPGAFSPLIQPNPAKKKILKLSLIWMEGFSDTRPYKEFPWQIFVNGGLFEFERLFIAVFYPLRNACQSVWSGRTLVVKIASAAIYNSLYNPVQK